HGARRVRGARHQFPRRCDGSELERRLAQLAVRLLDEEDRGARVVELVGDLRRREAPRDRVEDRARLRAGEEERDVLGRVARQRRDDLAAGERARELVGPRLELAVGRPYARRVDRDATRGHAGALAQERVDGVAAHPRNSVTSLTTSPGRSQKKRWPAPSSRTTREPEMRPASTSAFAGSTTLSAVPVTISVGAAISPAGPG